MSTCIWIILSRLRCELSKNLWCTFYFALFSFVILRGFVIIEMPAFNTTLSLCAISMMQKWFPLLQVIIDLML